MDEEVSFSEVLEELGEVPAIDVRSRGSER